ncbi:hypothetical protein HMPREF0239_02915 [Clostridium sp. ATCC BAA-442]|uniref:Uncharacterized protein n=1 Tax=Flavonifractor plautii ATCC 29863 TaxID=411475 RepID=G9YNB1_FLAPL|nr:hypothetical protein HMPREF0372_00983 [Flavonifractor plautii ATCC 29863]ERI73224.1 hypothetical protein HMPREF0239_02915 [Clostridium sp. ATCC BAA-442]
MRGGGGGCGAVWLPFAWRLWYTIKKRGGESMPYEKLRLTAMTTAGG